MNYVTSLINEDGYLSEEGMEVVVLAMARGHDEGITEEKAIEVVDYLDQKIHGAVVIFSLLELMAADKVVISGVKDGEPVFKAI